MTRAQFTDFNGTRLLITDLSGAPDEAMEWMKEV